jgi:hypothetical protein
MDIELVSNPRRVFKNAIKIYGDDVEFDFSTRKDKKYMIKDPNNNKWVHFGSIDYEDFTKHNDKERLKKFRQRNHKWANMPKYSSGYMSYHLLW